MHGSPRCRRNNAGTPLIVLCASVVALFWGCGGTDRPSRDEGMDGTLAEFLTRHEGTFRPSDYRLDFELIKAEEQQRFTALHAAIVHTTALAETIPGFRIQVLLTQEIDEANAALVNLEQQAPDDLVYMAYDAPYYKIRVGNFPERTAANTTLRRLVELGYKEAWIVPDNILKHPPPKLPDTFIEPKRTIDNNR